jgi:hypothetical protein
MANVNAPFGLSPVGNITSAAFNSMCEVMTTTTGDGTAIGIGDPILALGTSTTNADGTVTRDGKIAATTDVIDGVVVAILPDTRDSLLYRAANTVRRMLVCTDPNVLYVCQEGTGGTALTANDAGLNISLAIGSPSTTTGKSGATLDNSTEANTNTLAIRLIRPLPAVDNAIGDSCRWLVRINRHRYVDQVAGL